MKKNILIFGLINILATVAGNIQSLYFDASVIQSLLLNLGLIFFLAVASAYYYRKQKNGFSSFRNIFLVTLGGLTLGSILGTIAIVIYHGTLSEEAKLLLENQFLERQMSDLDSITNFNTFQERIEKAADRLFSTSHQLINILANLIFHSFISAVVALFMKKES